MRNSYCRRSLGDPINMRMPYYLEKMCIHAIDRSFGQLLDINIENFGSDELLTYIAQRYILFLYFFHLDCCYICLILFYLFDFGVIWFVKYEFLCVLNVNSVLWNNNFWVYCSTNEPVD